VQLYCCGVDNYHDWESYVMTAVDIEEMSTTPKGTTDGSSSAAASSSSSSPFSLWEGPQSCCHPRDVHNHQCVKQYVFREGCLDSLSYIVSESALLLGCGALAVAFIQVSRKILPSGVEAIFFSCWESSSRACWPKL
jgi:hypothetical protein